MKEQATIPVVGDRTESRIRARVVSRGIAVGTAVCLHGRKRQFFRIEITPDKVETEINRLRTAVKTADEQLEKITSRNSPDITNAIAEILDVHLLFLRESSLVSNCELAIADKLVNAEWAVKLVSDEYLDRYRAIADDHLREKAADLKDVTERILDTLSGNESSMRLPENPIIVANEIRPSTMLEFLRKRPAALVTEQGGWTSHVFIMAREMGIPAVAGVRNILRRIKTGDLVGVDALDGEIVRYPTEESQYQLAAKLESIDRSYVRIGDPVGSVSTLDGVKIRIAANVDKPDACRHAVDIGTNGIGLLRSEYLFEHLNALPDEDTQTAAYREVSSIAGPAGIRIRTFDIGIEQTSPRLNIRERNPALGLRAIRLSLVQERLFRVQIRSILKAATNANVRIVLPLVSGVEDIKRSLAIIKNEWTKLEEQGVPCGQPQLGAMIELPSAVFSINEILRYVDFVCLGTNDLVQYMVGVDRDNESVADWYQTLHPAVIRAVKTVLAASEAASVEAVMCGEMAGSPFYTPLLLGLGAREFSMNLHSINAVRRLIAGVAYQDTLELVDHIKDIETAPEIEDFLLTFYRDRWPDLFPPEIFTARFVNHR
ncbi:MAG: phosphoenolpyruvate--protein phosphotransferase [Pyrinomonadaceae bacterium]